MAQVAKLERTRDAGEAELLEMIRTRSFRRGKFTLTSGRESDLFFKGQPQELYDHLTCSKTLMRFTEEEGAGAHCQAGAGRLAFARIYDWLDETLS